MKKRSSHFAHRWVSWPRGPVCFRRSWIVVTPPLSPPAPAMAAMCMAAPTRRQQIAMVVIIIHTTSSDTPLMITNVEHSRHLRDRYNIGQLIIIIIIIALFFVIIVHVSFCYARFMFDYQLVFLRWKSICNVVHFWDRLYNFSWL